MAIRPFALRVNFMSTPELSIIIPTLNEAAALPRLLSDLARQAGIHFEIIISDGGSADETVEIAGQCFEELGLAGACLSGPAGRGRQLNVGARSARSEWLLFLHADNRLFHPDQLRRSLEMMRGHLQLTPSESLAGRFPLRFESPTERDFAAFYYETKARLNRSGCIHGDQGMLLKKTFFYTVGPFREDLPVMEDTVLAEQVRIKGEWRLLPGEIVTSARRFEVEGWQARQTLNALMMNFMAIGWLDFFAQAPELYQRQDRTRPLRLAPFYQLIHELLAQMSLRRRWGLWMATGAYVRQQSWQIGLALDCRRSWRRQTRFDDTPGPWLRWFDKWFEPLTNHRAGCLLTALLVRIWFSIQLHRKR